MTTDMKKGYLPKTKQPMPRFRPLALALIWALCHLGGVALAQEAEPWYRRLLPKPKAVASNLKMRTHYIGMGGLVLQDSYLSPLRYGGYSLSYLSESSRLSHSPLAHRSESLGADLAPTSLTKRPDLPLDDKWLHHSTSALDYGYTLNPARNGSIRRLNLRLDRGLMYRLAQGSLGRLYAGLGITAGAGTLYSSRNGNNPATAQVDLSLVARLAYSYQLPWQALPARLRLSAYSDILGTAFAQDFGENYYELYERSGSYASSFRLTHLGNSSAHRFIGAIDLPLWDSTTLSIAYRLQTHQRTLNHTHHRLTSHTLFVGITSYVRSFRGRKFVHDHAKSLPF